MIRHHAYNSSKAIVAPDCPMCGACMVEDDRVREQSHIYVWYVCSKTGCGGQWLSQISTPERFGNRSMKTQDLRVCTA